MVGITEIAEYFEGIAGEESKRSIGRQQFRRDKESPMVLKGKLECPVDQGHQGSIRAHPDLRR